MSTTKKDGIQKHKAGSTTAGSAQVFDIIPRNKVRPSTTSRPVIPSNEPAVADTTLATAPTLGRHRSLTIKPLSDHEELAATSETEATAQGVSVADLLAKRSKAAGDTPILPDSTEKSADAGKTTPAEAAPVENPVPTATVAGDKTITPPAVSEEPASEPKPSPEAPPADDSIEKALQPDEAKPPQPHNKAFKDAMNELDDSSNDKDGQSHHELYGGKPVIVIHKDHRAKSAFVWLLLCIVLAVVVLDVLLDAGVVSIDYDIPYTDFIKQ